MVRKIMASREQSTSSESSTTTKDIHKTVTSFGPVGTKVSVREAGENILDIFYHGYPDTDVSSIMPNFFSGNITELMDPRPNITQKEEEKRRGREINQEGEKHENDVFNLFLRLIRQSDISPTLLIMRTFEMDTKNNVGLKRKALLSELPRLNLKSANTTAENDFVVLVKDCGVVFIEVKGSTKDSNVTSAEKQLKNVNIIVQSVMKAITGDKQRTLPTVKLVVIPDCTDPSPREKTPQGSYFLFKESCDSFEREWVEVVKELQELKSSNDFSPDEFKELSQVLVGIWSANAVAVIKEGVRKYQLKQNEVDFSYVEQLKVIDEVVDTGKVRNESHFKLREDKWKPFTDIIRTSEQDVFRSCNDIKLCYLTPTQKEVYDNHKHALIHGVAGCGKSLLLLFKVIELVNNSESRVLILAPAPHNIRLCNFLRSNDVSVDIIEAFPPPSSESNVFVMDIKEFFEVEFTRLICYNITQYHIFVDDMHHMILSRLDGKDHKASFFDVADFIERTYATCVQHNTYCWFLLDVMQGGCGSGSGRYSQDLFMTADKQVRAFDIPIIQLHHVMRNTYEVIQLANQVHRDYTHLYQSASPPTPKAGHLVTSRKPLHHELQPDTGDEYKLPFIIARLREELKLVTKPPYSLQLSSVAIIWNNEEYFNKHKEAIASFLTTEFGTATQTIEEQLISNNKGDIIMDVEDNTMSFESQGVVFIRSGGDYGRYIYNICTRARVSLVVIDVTDSLLERFRKIDKVKWKPINSVDNDNMFMKYT